MPDEATLRIKVEAETTPAAGATPPTVQPQPPAAPPPGSGSDLRKNDLLDDIFAPKAPRAGPTPAFGAFGGRYTPPGAFFEVPPVKTIPTGQRFPGQASEPAYTAFGAQARAPYPTAQPIPEALPVAGAARTLENLLAGRLGTDSLRTAGYAATSAATGGAKTATGITSAGMSLASSGMLGAEAAGMAAGPVGIIATIAAKLVDTAIDTVAGGVAHIRKGIERLPGQAADVLQDRPLALFTKAVDNAAESLEQLPIIGKLASEEFRLAAAPVKAFAEMLEAATERGKQLAMYNADIAGAAAQQNVAGIQADIREANRMGPQYAKLIELQTGFDQTLREAFLPIKELITKLLIDVGKPLLEVAKAVGSVVGGAAEGANLFFDLQEKNFDRIWQNIPNVGVWDNLRKMRELAEEENKRQIEREGQTAMQVLLGMADRRFDPVGGVGAQLPANEVLDRVFANMGLPNLVPRQ